MIKLTVQIKITLTLTLTQQVLHEKLEAESARCKQMVVHSAEISEYFAIVCKKARARVRGFEGKDSGIRLGAC